MKIQPTKKLPILTVSYQHIVNKVPTIWVKLSIYPINELLSSSNLRYWEELLKLSNPQPKAFG